MGGLFFAGATLQTRSFRAARTCRPAIPGTSAKADAVLAASSNNTNAVATLDTPYADPDAEELRQR
jgi:hypothetical protein